MPLNILRTIRFLHLLSYIKTHSQPAGLSQSHSELNDNAHESRLEENSSQFLHFS